MGIFGRKPGGEYRGQAHDGLDRDDQDHAPDGQSMTGVRVVDGWRQNSFQHAGLVRYYQGNPPVTSIAAAGAIEAAGD